GEVKAARNSGQVVNSGIQTKKKLVAWDEPGKGFGGGFFTSFHYSAFHPSPGLGGKSRDRLCDKLGVTGLAGN
ncbi:MAG: hypothetical protein FWC45_06315, partial [Treponema sp.]|nr:hypothetical protein [Treponema sp.]